MKVAIVGLPAHPASPKKARPSRHRSTAPSPSCKLQPPPLQESILDPSPSSSSSLVPDPLPDTWNRYAKAFATLSGASALTERELRALLPVPRPLCHPATTNTGPATRSRAALGRKVEFALRAARKPYLRKYGVPMYALLGASEDALRECVLGGSVRVLELEKVNLRRVRVRIVWPHWQPPTGSATAASTSVVYDEWVRVDESVTRVQLAMRVAKVFNDFVEQQKTGDLSLSREQPETFKWRLRPDALYRTWLVRLERVETNVFAADLRYALNDP